MKIIALEAENLKRLTAVRIQPDGNLVQITGKNGQGKTSVLDAIWWALGSTKNLQTTPIRKGEERARVSLDLGELKVTRRFNAQEDGSFTTSIAVENADGATFRSPITMLDALLGELTFDPLAFMRMSPDEQKHALRSLVPDFDFEAEEKALKEDFDKRTVENRRQKEAAAAAEAIGRELPEEIPEYIEVEAVAEEFQNATAKNAATERDVEKRALIKQRAAELKKEITDLQKVLADREAEIAAWEDLPELVDVEALRTKLTAAKTSNRIAESAKERDRHISTAQEAKKTSEALTASILERRDRMKAAVAGAKLPVPGLNIDDDGIILNDLPLNQASDAEQLRTSIGIAMALNPKLKVIRVRDGSLLDEDAMKLLAEMADANDYQIWIERVDGSGSVGFVMEDGHVKGQIIEAPATEKAEPQEESAKPSPKKKPAPSLFDQ